MFKQPLTFVGREFLASAISHEDGVVGAIEDLYELNSADVFLGLHLPEGICVEDAEAACLVTRDETLVVLIEAERRDRRVRITLDEHGHYQSAEVRKWHIGRWN